MEAMGVIACHVSDKAGASLWKQAGSMIYKRLAYMKALAKDTQGCVAWAYMTTGGAWRAEIYSEQAFDDAGNLEQSDDWTTCVPPSRVCVCVCFIAFAARGSLWPICNARITRRITRIPAH